MWLICFLLAAFVSFLQSIVKKQKKTFYFGKNIFLTIMNRKRRVLDER